jgi:hypothetical protein
MSTKAAQIYEIYIKSLPVHERLELLALVTQDLLGQGAQAAEPPKHSIRELHGLGKEIWEGIDAQEYVNKLRDEWELPA